MKIYFIDGDILVGDNSNELFYKGISQYCDNKKIEVAQNRKGIFAYIGKVYTEYIERKKENNDNNIFVIIRNLQFIDVLKSIHL